ncbi:MAG: MFS transporter [Eggerthellaceae bacterium]|nr:MFS transporter [Eggerthellaceae bacterium]
MQMGNRRWIRMAAGALIMICIGIIYMWSVFGGFVIEEYGWSASDSGLTASFMIAFFSVGSLVGGKIQDKIGPRWVCLMGIIGFFVGVFSSSFTVAMGPVALYLTFGVLGGFGGGFAYNAVMACIQKWFPDKINLATGVVVTCFGLATVVFSPVASAVGSAVGVSAALQIMGVVFLVACLIGWTQMKAPEEGWLPEGFELAGESAAESRQYTLSEALRTPQMWIMFFGVMLVMWTFFGINPILKQIASERVGDASLATAAVMVASLGMACGRLFFPFVVNKIGRRWTAFTLAVMVFVSGIALAFASGPVFLVLVFVAGVSAGAPGVVWPTWTAENFGLKNNGANFGFILLAVGLSSLLSMRVGSAFSAEFLGGDVSGYFLIGAVMAAIAALLILLFKPVDHAKAGVEKPAGKKWLAFRSLRGERS